MVQMLKTNQMYWIALLYLFGLSINFAQQLVVKPGVTISATGDQLDSNGDLWWVDRYNQYSFNQLRNLVNTPCSNASLETKFRYYNNAGQVYVRMTSEWIFAEFWYPYVFWSGYATTAQINDGVMNQCYQCIAAAGFPNPELYNFAQQRASNPNNNCWDECIGNNTFLNTGDTDQDPVFSWAFFEAQIFRNLTLPSFIQRPDEYRLPPNNIVDLFVNHTFNRSMEIVRVSNAWVYSFLDGSLFRIGATEVPYVHGCWFRKWVNPSGDEWISPFKYNPPLPNPFNHNFKDNTCFTWIASSPGVTGKFGTLNEQYYVDQAGIVCPNSSCIIRTTASPTKRPTFAPTSSIRPTPAPTVRPLANITFTGIPCRTGNMDLFVIVDASKSISDEGFAKEKVWLKQLFRRTKNEFVRMNSQMAALGYSDRFCFRAGIVTFSYLIQMPMNFSMWNCNNGGYDISVGESIIDALGRPHPPNTRFAGTHIRDALDGALLMYNSSNKTCTNFYGIALTDGLPQSYRTGADTNQNPCLAGYRGVRFQKKLSNFWWVPVEREPPFNTDLFNCLLSPPTQNIIIANTIVPLVPLNATQCPLCQTKPPTRQPTRRPTRRPTSPPTRRPTSPPTRRPTSPPTRRPTSPPTRRPTSPPTRRPTSPPTRPPTRRPTLRPTSPPSRRPTQRPSSPPTRRPTRRPSLPPSRKPTRSPSRQPTGRPTRRPSSPPTARPTRRPTGVPSARPTRRPTLPPTLRPTRRPTLPPTRRPTRRPTGVPSLRPTRRPTGVPSIRPTRRPTLPPTLRPTRRPTGVPSLRPTRRPTLPPTRRPTRRPTGVPSLRPTRRPTGVPSLRPTRRPTGVPSLRPTRRPTGVPSARPTRRPTAPPTLRPTRRPTAPPSLRPTRRPTAPPSLRPTRRPTSPPSLRPTRRPTPAPTPECIMAIDVVIVVDESCGASVTAQQCLNLKQGLMDIAYDFHVGSNLRSDARIGVVTYTNHGIVKLDLNMGNDMNTIRNAIFGIQCSGGLPYVTHNLANAIDIANGLFVNAKRIINNNEIKVSQAMILYPMCQSTGADESGVPLCSSTRMGYTSMTRTVVVYASGLLTHAENYKCLVNGTSTNINVNSLLYNNINFDVQQYAQNAIQIDTMLCHTLAPTRAPTKRPTSPPSLRPTRRPTSPPSLRPTRRPTSPPSLRPTRRPTGVPSLRPTRRPTLPPTLRPTRRPTGVPSLRPTRRPTGVPSARPTRRPTGVPSARPTRRPTGVPSLRPTRRPTLPPTRRPTRRPTGVPSLRPTRRPTGVPTLRPTRRPTLPPTLRPTRRPTGVPSLRPTRRPTLPPTLRPTRRPTSPPSLRPTRRPTGVPTKKPTQRPTRRPTGVPSARPTLRPTRRPTSPPSLRPTRRPTSPPSLRPTRRPTGVPSLRPTRRPTGVPTLRPTRRPTGVPTLRPTRRPTLPPTRRPTRRPTGVPSLRPTRRPTGVPSLRPTRRPTGVPSLRPTRRPTLPPTRRPTRRPTSPPSLRPTRRPTGVPSARPTRRPTLPPSLRPTRRPTLPPTRRPTRRPTGVPSLRPTRRPTGVPTLRPTRRPTLPPTLRPTRRPTGVPSLRPTRRPTGVPTLRPTRRPTGVPTLRPTRRPSTPPSRKPTRSPSRPPTGRPSRRPTSPPSLRPTRRPTSPPSLRPTRRPSTPPSGRPTRRPTLPPTLRPTRRPTSPPSLRPTRRPTTPPSLRPTHRPTTPPSLRPTRRPTSPPSLRPTHRPTSPPSLRPTRRPTSPPSNRPTRRPTQQPTTLTPTMYPTMSPTVCIPPPPHPAQCACTEMNAEWNLELIDFVFDEHKERTFVQYQVCVYARNPHNTCNPSSMPSPLEKLFIQVPCNCDICIDFVTKDMSPDGFTTELDRGWVWEHGIQPGECKFFELAIKGHATLKTGSYQLFGADDRCVSNTILVPDVCEELRPPHPQHWAWESATESPQEGCEPREPLFTKEMCWDACDSVDHTEWSIHFVSTDYNPVLGTTTFTWQVNTSNTLPSPTCNLFGQSPAPLTDVSIRLGCDCEPQSETYLRSITSHMTPTGVAESDYWRFDNLDITAGQSKQISIVLKGQVTLNENGDATLGGDHRCASTLSGSEHAFLAVPNPCSDVCNFGEWTEWQLQGACSTSCGGGEQIRTRTCVSICNQGILVDNCPGEAHGTVPCNTQPCPVHGGSVSSSSSSSEGSNVQWSHP